MNQRELASPDLSFPNWLRPGETAQDDDHGALGKLFAWAAVLLLMIAVGTAIT